MLQVGGKLLFKCLFCGCISAVLLVLLLTVVCKKGINHSALGVSEKDECLLFSSTSYIFEIDCVFMY